MKVTKEKIEDSQAFLTVTMEPTEMEKAREDAYHRLVKKTTVPGFRKGKAPRAMLERYLGKESLLENAVNGLIPEAYEQAIKEQEIEAFASPTIEVTQEDPLVFKATVPLPPVITLGDYLSLRLKKEPVKVGKDKVEAVVERLQHQQAVWEPVERPVSYGDMAVFDIESTIEDKPFISQKGAQYQVLENYAAPLPGFAEQMHGMARDETKDFKLEIPPDYPKPELVGKEAAFSVKLNEVKQEKLPELDDEFAKAVDAKFETVTQLKKGIKDNLKLREEERTRLEFEEKVIEAAVEQAEVTYPPFMVDMEVNRLLDQQLRQWQQSGRGLDDYLASMNKTEEELREEMRPVAVKRVVRSLVLAKITEVEKIEASEEEIDAEAAVMLKETTEIKRDEFKKLLAAPQSRASIRQLLVRRKTVQRLLEIAQSSEKSKEKAEKEVSK